MTDAAAPRRDVRGIAAAFLATLVLYAVSTSPVVFWGDSAEFARRAASLELSPVARGYPLHRVLTWLAGRVAGDPALGANAVSAVFGAASAALAYEVARRLWDSRLGGAASAAAHALCGPYWMYAGVAEVYTLHTAFALGLVLTALDAPRSRASAVACGVLLGLSFLHHRMTAFLVPALAAHLLVALRRPGAAGRFRDVLAGFGAGVVPFAVLCAAASRTPPEGASPAAWWFRDVFLGGDHNTGHLLGSGTRSFAGNVAYVGRWIAYGFPGPALALAVWGLARLLRRGRPEAWLFGLALPLHLVFPLRYDWTGDQFSFLTPFFALLAPLVAGGVAAVAERWGPGPARLAVASVVAAPAALAVALAFTPLGVRVLPTHTDAARRETFLPVRAGRREPEDFARANLGRAPRGAVLHADWGDGQVYLYLQRVLGQREDVEVRIFYGGRPRLLRDGRPELLSTMPLTTGTPRAAAALGDAVEPLGGGLWRIRP